MSQGGRAIHCNLFFASKASNPPKADHYYLPAGRSLTQKAVCNKIYFLVVSNFKLQKSITFYKNDFPVAYHTKHNQLKIKNQP